MQVKYRNIAFYLIVSIVTGGLFGLYWLYCLANDMHYGTNGKTSSGGAVLLLTIITCGIYGWYWLYKSGSELDAVRFNNGESMGHLGVLYLVLGVFGLGIVAYALMQDEINRYAQV